MAVRYDGRVVTSDDFRRMGAALLVVRGQEGTMSAMSAHGGPLPTEDDIMRWANQASNKGLDEVSPDIRHQALLRLVDAALRLRYEVDKERTSR